MQTQRMVDEKGTYGATGGLLHSGLHGWATMLTITAFFTVTTSWGITGAGALGILLGALDAVIHYHIDWAKMNLSRDFTINDRMYWTLLGLDQMLHYLTYTLIIWILIWAKLLLNL